MCLLQEVATRLQQALRKSDTLARMGGDEFTVIMPCVTEPPHVSLVARRILAALENPVRIAGRHGPGLGFDRHRPLP